MERTRMGPVLTTSERTRLESRKRAKLESIVTAAMAADSNYAASFGRRKRQSEGKKERWRPWQIKDQVHTVDRKRKVETEVQNRIFGTATLFPMWWN